MLLSDSPGTMVSNISMHQNYPEDLLKFRWEFLIQWILGRESENFYF